MIIESNEILLAFYTQMIRIRMIEERLREIFTGGEIPGFIHVCIGQEATPVAVCSNLKKNDYITTTHRGHGHVLAKGIDLKLFMAELFGRKNGLCRGRSGSMHIADAQLGILGANGIVGAGLPIANGAALSSKYLKSREVTVCFFGEGATSEGTFHESLNIAALLKLPIVFVCENNQWAEFTSIETHMKNQNVADRAISYGISGECVENDFLKIYNVSQKMIEKARNGEGPSFLEVKSARWHGHYVGDAQKYRSKEDVNDAVKQDCIASFEQYLLKNKKIKKKNIETIRKVIAEDIATAVEFARASPMPEPSDLIDD